MASSFGNEMLGRSRCVLIFSLSNYFTVKWTLSRCSAQFSETENSGGGNQPTLSIIIDWLDSHMMS